MSNFLANISSLNNILQNPGDRFEAKITKTNRRVAKAQIGDKKISVTQYPNGRIVETRSYSLNDK